MLSKFKQRLLFASILRNSNEKVRMNIREDNRKSAIFWAVIQLIFWSFSLLMSRIDPEYMDCLPIYIIVLVVCAVALFLAHFVCPKRLFLVSAVAIALNLALLGAGVGITVLKPHLRSAVIFCTLLIVPVSYVMDTLTSLVLILIDFLVLVIAGFQRMDPDIFQWTVTFFIVFGSVGILMGHFINKTRFERYVFAESAMQLAELQKRYAYYDQMTGLKNRRAYSEKLDELAKEMPADLCVVMADLNGLKRANDTMGHEAGDELIIGASECLSQAFDGAGTVYRIGGDEFCGIMERTLPEAMHCLERLAEVSSGWKGRFINGVSLSCGVETNQDCTDIEAIVKEADRKMYAEKSNYYRNSGIDRRRR